MSDSEKLAALGAIALDVDGVLTDGTFSLDANGDETKRFSFEDVMGLSRAKKAGLHLGLISGEDSLIVDAFAAKIGIKLVTKGSKQKGEALKEFAQRLSIPLDRVAFIGDDVNDLPAFAIAGYTAAPSNARPEVKRAASIVLSRSGGNGAVREFIEKVLACRDRAPEKIS